MRTPRHLPRNTAARDLRKLKLPDLDPFVEQLMHDEHTTRKLREAQDTQFD